VLGVNVIMVDEHNLDAHLKANKSRHRYVLSHENYYDRLLTIAQANSHSIVFSDWVKNVSLRLYWLKASFLGNCHEQLGADRCAYQFLA
jgi:hypothetical protein